jgi:hypothetical protein
MPSSGFEPFITLLRVQAPRSRFAVFSDRPDDFTVMTHDFDRLIAKIKFSLQAVSWRVKKQSICFLLVASRLAAPIAACSDY